MESELEAVVVIGLDGIGIAVDKSALTQMPSESELDSVSAAGRFDRSRRRDFVTTSTPAGLKPEMESPTIKNVSMKTASKRIF